MFEKRFRFGNPEKEKPSRSAKMLDRIDQHPEEKISRRKFLKYTGAVATALGLGGGVALLFKDRKGDEEKEIKEKKLDFQIFESEPTEGQTNIEIQDQTIVGSTIEEQLRAEGKITLDRSTKKAIFEKWCKSYSPNDGENYPGLETALTKMAPWVDQMKEIFQAEGVPPEYVFLAIPESHFDVSAVSRKAAGGPFQFTQRTARKYGLQMSANHDERFDPLLSAKACAKHLKQSHEAFNEDWELALADYNGNYTNRYAETFRKKKSQRNYDDYLSWREGRLNEYISRPYYEHEVEKGDTLGTIAEVYDLEPGEIKKLNKMKNDTVILGAKIKLPPEISVKMIKLRDSLENLNYPEKFFAVLDVIEEFGLEEKFPGKKMQFQEVDTPRNQFAVFAEEVRKGEGLLAVSRRILKRSKTIDSGFDLSVNEIVKKLQKQNKIKGTNIALGQKLSIKLNIKSPSSLQNFAAEKGIDLGKLKQMNPAIIDEKKPMTHNRKIRIPK